MLSCVEPAFGGNAVNRQAVYRERRARRIFGFAFRRQNRRLCLDGVAAGIRAAYRARVVVVEDDTAFFYKKRVPVLRRLLVSQELVFEFFKVREVRACADCFVESRAPAEFGFVQALIERLDNFLLSHDSTAFHENSNVLYQTEHFCLQNFSGVAKSRAVI